MKIGDIVTILVEYPCGVEKNKWNYVKDETGVIVDVDTHDPNELEYSVKLSPTDIFSWWFASEEIRSATEDEIAEKLRSLMMK